MQRFISSLVMIVALAAPAQAATKDVDGWAGFKFGMTPDQIRALPGQSFGRYSGKNFAGQNSGAMASTRPMVIAGAPYNLDLMFDAAPALDEIALWNQENTSRADCQAAFLALLSGLEKNYGGFAPVYPPHKKSDQDRLPMSVEWIGNPAHYHLATVYMDGETATVWNGRKYGGGHMVDASAVWSAASDTAQAPCLLEIDLRA